MLFYAVQDVVMVEIFLICRWSLICVVFDCTLCLNRIVSLLYVTMNHKTSHKGQFFEIKISASYIIHI